MIEINSFVPITEAEGPSKRFAIWLQGCSIRCKGCCNPHLFQRGVGKKMAPEALMAEVLKIGDEIDGVSLLGGEPFDQAEALAPFLELVAERGLSVVVFTGYTLDEIQKGCVKSGVKLLPWIDLLIDGPYVSRRAVSSRRWIGSSNQRIHHLTDRLKKEVDESEEQTNTIEIHIKKDEVVFNGFPLDLTEERLNDLGLIIR